MALQADKTTKTDSLKTAADSQLQRAANETGIPAIGPASANHQSLKDMANQSRRVTQLKTYQSMADQAVIQRQTNATGLPDNLKSGIENLSGYSMNDVKVHYNSDKPAQLNAHAYAQGTNIHLASGQEKHLPHEAWHVVQQKQGRVQATKQLKGKVAINDDAGLEREADVMGTKALSTVSKTWDGGLINLSGNGLVAQRTVENAKYDKKSKHLSTVEGFFTMFNRATANAFDFVISVPSLDGYAGLNGYMELWVKKWKEYLKSGTPQLLSATFGYVIETLVSDSSSEFFPGCPPDYQVLTQVSVGGTRPDLVLAEKSGAHVAWLDITAGNSVDHIFNKDSWDRKVSMYAEVSYPSLDPGYLSLMKQNKDNKGKLDKKEIEKRMLEAKKAYNIQKEEWIKLGEGYKKNALKNELDYKPSMAQINEALPRNFIYRKLMKDFKVGYLEEKMVPSILLAMGVGPGPWGFNMGYSGNEKAGETWLMENPFPKKEVEMIIID